MGRLIQIIIIVTAILVAYRLVRGLIAGTGSSKFPCESCRNCKTVFEDGVICAFGSKETFKNETHISNCRDYKRGRVG